jgi:hypothetical protein
MPVAPIGGALPPAAIAPATTTRSTFRAVLDSRAAVLRPSAPPAPRDHPAASALAHVERAQARLDAVLAAARAGRTFTAAELIGLQAEAYRCAQTIDLASKLVEQGAQSMKQALNTQL